MKYKNRKLKIDIAGKKFGALIPIYFMYKDREKNLPGGWFCACDCGGFKLRVPGVQLKEGRISSCGCLNTRSPEQILEAGITYFIDHNMGAKYKKHEISITKEDIKNLIFKPCTYCASPPSREMRIVGRGRKRVPAFLYNGIDRIDSSKGYIPGNVITCCLSCNQAKSDTNLEDFILWLEKLTQNLPSFQKLEERLATIRF